MKKNRLFALLLAALMLVCAFGAGAEEEPDVIIAGRYSVKLTEAQKAVDELVAQYAAYFQQQGYTLSAEQYAYICTMALQQRAVYCVIDNILEDRGYPELTDEELAQIKADVQAAYDETYDYVKQYYITNYGLSEEQAEERLERYGENKLAEAKKTTVLQRFFQQLKDPMLLILLAAAAVSAVTNALSGESFTEVFIILVVVLLNAVLGVIQESKAEAAIEALQNRQAYADELFDTIPQRKKQQLAGLLDSLLHTWDIPINEEEYQYRNTEE